MTPALMGRVVELSLASKKWFIEIDEFDRAERLVLNLGHTFGHALEAASHYRLGHGIAVGIGILCALKMSESIVGPIRAASAVALERHIRALLAEVPELAGNLGSIDLAVALDRLKSDKKHESTAYRFVLFDADGAASLVRLPKSPDSDARIVAAFRQVVGGLS
jgi:3-dehydroquinate synthase